MYDLAKRMKEKYELREKKYLTAKIPVIIRIDGKAFHTYTRNMEKPFDRTLINTMVESARSVMNEIQGCKLAYVQSDEASFLLTDYDNLQTDGWFDYCQSKIESVSASMFTAFFNAAKLSDKYAFFDSRSFNIPKEDVTNYFLWRMKDWERNSVCMLCSAHYSHKQMHKQGKADMHEMLYQKGINWNDLESVYKNGTIITKTEDYHIRPEYNEVNNIIKEFL